MSRTLLVLFGLLAACGPTQPGEIWQDQLDLARTHWEQVGPLNYQFRYTRHCFCPQLVLDVTVQSGAVTAIHDVVADTAYTAPLPDYSMPAVFERIQEMINQPVHQLSATYHSVNGVPLGVAADPIRDAIDDEHGFTIGAFVALP
jgi:hypothetical protein